MNLSRLFGKKPKDHSYYGNMETPTTIKVPRSFFDAIEASEKNPKPNPNIQRTMSMKASDIKLR